MLLLRERSRAARPSSRVDRLRLPVTAALDGWPPARASGYTEPGLQVSSPAAQPLTCGSRFSIARGHTSGTHRLDPGRGEHRVDRTSAEVVGVEEQVPADVHRLDDRRVTEPGLDRLRVQPGRDQGAGAEMPEIVVPGALRQPAASTASCQHMPKLLRCCRGFAGLALRAGARRPGRLESTPGPPWHRGPMQAAPDGSTARARPMGISGHASGR